MADVQRYRSGPVSEVRTRVKAGVQVDVGDLVTMVTAGKVDTFTSAALTAAVFRSTFVGVVTQGHTTGSETTDTPCLCYTFGEFEFDLSAAAVSPVEIGGLVAASADQVVATGGILGAAGTGTAIGRLARRVEVGDTKALVRIESVLFGGSQPLT